MISITKKAGGAVPVFRLLILFPLFVAAQQQTQPRRGSITIPESLSTEEFSKRANGIFDTADNTFDQPLFDGVVDRNSLIQAVRDFAGELKAEEGYITEELQKLERERSGLNQNMWSLQERYDKIARSAQPLLGGGGFSEPPSPEKMTAVMELQTQISVTGEKIYKLDQNIAEWEQITNKDQDVLALARELQSLRDGAKNPDLYVGYWLFVEGKLKKIRRIAALELFLEAEEGFIQNKAGLKKRLKRHRLFATAGLGRVSLTNYVKETAGKALRDVYPRPFDPLLY